MKLSKKTEIATIVLLIVVTVGAVVWLWAFGAAGLPGTERQEANGSRLFFTAWLALSLILAPLLAKLLGWGFISLESNEPAQPDEQSQGDEGGS